MKTTAFFYAVISILLLSGCASKKLIYKPDELEDILAQQLTTDELAALEIPFLATPDMIDYARNAISDEINTVKKSIRLVEAITSEWKLDVSYDRTADATAEKVFHETKRANCLSFTHLFVSLARAVGIKAHYVDVRNDELFAADNVIISSRHICAGVHDGGDFFLIDFDPDPRKSYRLYQKIDDIEAIANHYNNIAINQFGNSSETLKEALDLLEMALRIKPDFSRALNNRGSILFLLGFSDQAEESFRRALFFDPRMPEANSNLSGILLEKGSIASALEFARHAVQGRPGNLQYHYRLGIALLFSAEYNDAFKEFRWVIRREPNHYKALHGMALTAYHMGKYEIAEDSISKATIIEPGTNDFIYLKALIRLKKSNS